jgi:hypothetical protein
MSMNNANTYQITLYYRNGTITRATPANLETVSVACASGRGASRGCR